MDTKRFIKIPYSLLVHPRYQNLSASAKLLYSYLADRAQLSANNGWKDINGNVFIYCTIHETQQLLGCGHNKATAIMQELERFSLICRTPQGLGKPHRTVVYPCDSAGKPTPNAPAKRRNSRRPDIPKPATNKTDILRPINIDTAANMIRNMCTDATISDLPIDSLKSIVDCLADLICYPENAIPFGTHRVPYDDVCRRIWALTPLDIRTIHMGYQYHNKPTLCLQEYILEYLTEKSSV